MGSEKVIIDTDPGVDDAMAILYAILSPEIELLGLTSIFGNVTIDTATRNALALGDLARTNIPVAKGADKPMVQPLREPAWEVHGREGFGDTPAMEPSRSAVSESAAEFICETVNAHPGEVVLCPIGPLTNLALALQLDPGIAGKVKSVTVMGGSLEEGGNVTPHAEANIWQDPHAADVVLGAQWPVKLVGLDVTHRIICTPEDMANLVEPAPILGGFLNQASQFYFQFHRKVDGIRGCHMHDPSAVISIIRPELFVVDPQPVAVIVEGEEVGKTQISADSGRPKVSICREVDAESVLAEFFDVIESGF